MRQQNLNKTHCAERFVQLFLVPVDVHEVRQIFFSLRNLPGAKQRVLVMKTTLISAHRRFQVYSTV